MTNPNDPAFPIPVERHGQNGLSKREYFAALAMQGMIASEQETLRFAKREELVSEAVIMADALIAELSKSK